MSELNVISRQRGNESKKSLSLMQKLTILIAFPLVFEFVFVGGLTGLLVTAQSDAKQLDKAKEQQSLNEEIMRSMYQLTSTGFVCSLKKDAIALEAYHSARALLPEQLEELRTGCANNPEAKRSSQILSVLSNRLIDSLDAITEPEKTSFDGYLRVASEVGHLTRSMMKENKIIATLNQKIHPHQTAHTDWQTIIYAVLAAGMVLSVTVSAGALRYVHLDLLQRIAKIMRNTEAIAHREQLVETVQGSDELAELDAFVHATDDSLRQLERMRQEFFAMLTHDMRAPLTQIQFSVSLLADGAYEDSPEKRHKMMRTLVPEIARLNRLVDDVLSANKLESEPVKLVMETICAKELLTQVRDEMELEASSRGRSISVKADDSKILADPFQIGRVITNLCANGLKYAPAGGAVELSCRAQGDSVLFEILDTGPGIPPHLAPHLFERYSQGDDDKTRSGFGLGLYIAKVIVTEHGGQIGFQNKTEGDTVTGCVFFFTAKSAGAC